jgi:murein DD-endopeptidase MepM/ murein hydrolase activator NlpD
MPMETLGTFLFVPRRTEEIRTVAITRTGLAVAGGFALLILLFLSVVAFQLFRSRPVQPLQVVEKSGAATELEALEDRLSTLDGQMDILLRRNEELRTLANLPEIPVEVAAVGVGGPGHEEVAGLPAPGESGLQRRLSAAETDLDVLLRRSRLVSRSMSDAEGIIRSKTERWTSTPSIWPTDGFLSSPFSYARKHPLLGSFRPHYGVDISARAGNRVVATADGVVRFAGWRSGSGNHVEIDHGFGIATTYSHSARLLVKTGERVRRGTPIGFVGSTGFSLGPHVHYEVHKLGHPIDPAKFIFPNVAAD